MKVEAATSFIDSLKRMGSFDEKWRLFWGWVRYHLFNKNFYALLKVVYKTYPWDEGFLYDLEKAKIQEMRKYHERAQRFVGVEQVIRDMKICENLIDIFMEKADLFHYAGDIIFERNEDGNYTAKRTDDFKYICDVNVNLKNIDRFVDNEHLKQYYRDHPHEFYELKAKALYHKIRYEKDGHWWD